MLSRRAQDKIQRAGPAAATLFAARHRQTWRGGAASDGGAFPFFARAHHGDRESDDSVALFAAFPLRPRRGAGRHLPGDGRFLSRPRRILPQGGARLRRRRLPIPAARRSEPGLSLRPIATRTYNRARRGPRRVAGDLRAHDQCRDSDIPHDMTITMHLCRGNFRSSFVASGGYELVAEVLFNGINVHGYFMEYDSDRAGGFEPLRLLPKGKSAVLGLVTSKSGGLESRDEIKKRIEQAAKYAPLDQLCLSPQCGFASTEEGNVLSEDEQWAKLRMIVEIAEEVWG